MTEDSGISLDTEEWLRLQTTSERMPIKRNAKNPSAVANEISEASGKSLAQTTDVSNAADLMLSRSYPGPRW